MSQIIRQRNYFCDLTTVVFDDTFSECKLITSTANLFCNCKMLSKIIGIQNLWTDNVTDMRYMFACCRKLIKHNVCGLRTNKVTYMHGIFLGFVA